MQLMHETQVMMLQTFVIKSHAAHHLQQRIVDVCRHSARHAQRGQLRICCLCNHAQVVLRVALDLIHQAAGTRHVLQELQIRKQMTIAASKQK
jgi:hypothetical protein